MKQGEVVRNARLSHFVRFEFCVCFEQTISLVKVYVKPKRFFLVGVEASVRFLVLSVSPKQIKGDSSNEDTYSNVSCPQSGHHMPPCACMGFLLVLWFPSSFQRLACRLKGH